MKNFIYGLVVKISLIVVGVGAVLVINKDLIEGSDELSGTLSQNVEGVEQFVSRLWTARADADMPVEVSMAKPAELVPPVPVERSPQTIPAYCRNTAAGSNRVVIGDRIQIRLFESDTGMQRNGEGFGRKAAFERLDLSGSHEVGADGTVSIPLLGRINVVGRSLPCVEAIVAREAFDYSSSDVSITVTFNNRPAVTALGDLRAAGRYEYSPGMTVQQLLSLAGAKLDAPSNVPVQNAPYLEARQYELEAALMSNVIKMGRINAAMTGSDDLVVEAAQMADAEEILGKQRIQAERTALAAINSSREMSIGQLRDEKEKLEQMLDAKGKHLTLVEYQLKKLSERHSELVALQKRGVVPMKNVSDSELGMMSLHRIALETKATLLELEARSQRLSSDTDRLLANEQQQLAFELRNVSEEANGLESQLQTVKMQLGPKEVQGAKTHLAVMVERSGVRGAQRFEAMPETIILPGDVVTAVLQSGPTEERYAWSIETLGEKVAD